MYNTAMTEVTTYDHFNNVVKIGDTVGYRIRNSAIDRDSYEVRISKVVEIIFNSYYGYIPRVDEQEYISSEGKFQWLTVLPDSIQKLNDATPYEVDDSLPLVIPYEIYEEEMRLIYGEQK